MRCNRLFPHQALTVLLLCVVLVVLAATAFAANKTEIRITLVGNMPNDWETVHQAIEAKLAKSGLNYDLKVTWYNWQDWANQRQIKLMAGDNGELFFDAPWADGWNNLTAKNAYLELSSYIKKYGNSIRKHFPPDYLKANSFDGKILGLPLGISYPAKYGLAVRADLRKKYGIDKIASYDDLEKFLAAVKKNNPEITPIVDNGNGIFTETMAYREGYTDLAQRVVAGMVVMQDLLTTGGKVKMIPAWESKTLVDLSKRVRQWYLNGWLDKDILSQRDARGVFLSGAAAIGPSAPENADRDIPQLQANVPGAEIEWDWIASKNFPLLHDFKMWNFICVNTHASHPVEAFKFLNWIYASQDNYDLIQYGIKGRHWVEGPQPRTYELPAGVDPAKNYNFDGFTLVWNPDFNRFPAKGNPQAIAIMKAATDPKNYAVAPYAGWTFDSSAVKTEVAQCTALEMEYAKPVFLGVIDTESGFTKMKEAYEAAGINKIIAEAQKQFDAWVAKRGGKNPYQEWLAKQKK